jgi:hypothetical protein
VDITVAGHCNENCESHAGGFGFTYDCTLNGIQESKLLTGLERFTAAEIEVFQVVCQTISERKCENDG